MVHISYITHVKLEGQSQVCILQRSLMFHSFAMKVGHRWGQFFHFLWSEHFMCSTPSNRCDFCCLSQRKSTCNTYPMQLVVVRCSWGGHIVDARVRTVCILDIVYRFQPERTYNSWPPANQPRIYTHILNPSLIWRTPTYESRKSVLILLTEKTRSEPTT